MSPQRGLHRATLAPRGPVHQGQVALIHLPLLQLPGQQPLRPIVLGHHNQAGRVPVQAVHDPRALLPPIRDSSAVCARRALTSVPVGCPGAGCTTIPRRLVDHQQVVVLVDDAQRNRFRRRPSRRVRKRKRHLDPVTHSNALRGPPGAPVHQHLAAVESGPAPVSGRGRAGARPGIGRAAPRPPPPRRPAPTLAASSDTPAGCPLRSRSPCPPR